jgi:hypothetical protein
VDVKNSDQNSSRTENPIPTALILAWPEEAIGIGERQQSGRRLGDATMSNRATVTLVELRFVAAVSDGRQLDRGDIHEMAEALFRAGVPADDVRYEWGVGRRMITSGQQVALRAEIRRLERESEGLFIAA